MRFMLKQYLKYPKEVLVYTLSTILGITSTIIDTILIVQITNVLNEPEKVRENLFILGLEMIGLILSFGFNAYLSRYTTYYLYTHSMNDFMEKVKNADMNMFTKYSVANIVSASESIFHLTKIGKIVRSILMEVLTIAVTLASIWYLGGKIIIPVVVLYFFIALVIVKVYRKFYEYDEECETHKKKRNQMIDDFIMGFQEFKTFGNQGAFLKKFKDINFEVFDLLKERGKLSEKLEFAFRIGNHALMFVIILASLYMIGEGQLTPAVGLSMTILASRIIEPIDVLLDLADEFSETNSKLKYYKEICGYENIYDNSEESIQFDAFQDKIEVKDLSFAYAESSSNCVNGVNMVIHKGDKIGICGLSGAGKSSLFKLLNKFYNYKGGEILVDNIPLSKITDASWRKHVGVVHQENFIFPGTIKENITFGTEKYTETELVEACKSANLYDFIMSLPDKFDTEVGPRGLKLSGGQKQRIAIARLFMKNPEIILLDEATSALDNINENIIKEAIDKLSKDKTVITIAHRITTIENCDCIYVMKNGRVVEEGTFDQLVAEEGSEFNKIREGRA